MKNVLKKLVLMITVFSMVLSLVAIPASAATLKTYLVTDFTTDSNGAITGGNDINIRQKDVDNDSTAYYKTGDEFFTVETSSTATSVSPGTEILQEFSEITTTFMMKARLGFDAQTAEISWRPWGMRESGTSGNIKTMYFKNGKIYLGNSSTDSNNVDTGLTYSTSVPYYDIVIQYTVASAQGAADAKIKITLSDGTTTSTYTGALPSGTNYSTIKGNGFVVNKPSTGTNKLKIYSGWSFSSIGGIPEFGNELEDIDFEGWVDSDIPTSNGAKVTKSNITNIYVNSGNTSEIVDETEGAYDGDSLKFTVGTIGSQQLRPQLSEITPIRFEFKFKADSFGTSNFSLTGANGAVIFRITKSGGLFLSNESTYGINELETGKWYLVRGYHNPGDTTSGTDDYAYLELCTTDGKVTHKKSCTLPTFTSSEKKYLTLFCPTGSTYYIDDLKISEASAISADTANFGVVDMAPAYGNNAPVYHDAKLTLSKAADTSAFTADSIYICNDGTKVDATGYSWNTDNTVLSIPVNSTGHYRICIFGLKDTSGNAIENPYMEFDVTSPKVVFTSSGNDLTATFKTKSSDIQGKETAVLVIAGYAGGALVLKPVSFGDAVTNDNVTTLTATLPEGNTLQDVRAYIWEGLGTLVPLTPVANYR